MAYNWRGTDSSWQIKARKPIRLFLTKKIPTECLRKPKRVYKRRSEGGKPPISTLWKHLRRFRKEITWILTSARWRVGTLRMFCQAMPLCQQSWTILAKRSKLSSILTSPFKWTDSSNNPGTWPLSLPSTSRPTLKFPRCGTDKFWKTDRISWCSTSQKSTRKSYKKWKMPSNNQDITKAWPSQSKSNSINNRKQKSSKRATKL